MDDLTVFFSWQSDLERAAHRQIIRDALREAGGKLEADGVVAHLDVQEAARGAPGSPDISTEIFRKIADADIFVADLSIVHRRADASPRAFPNPNVAVELGFAVARLGWERTIVVVNDHSGKPEDLPFDVRGRAVARYRCHVGDETAARAAIGTARGMLRAQLIESLKLIATLRPKLPVVATVDAAAIRRERDITVIRRLLAYANPDAIRELLDTAPAQIPRRAFYFQEEFADAWRDATTQLHDTGIRGLFRDLDGHWATPLSFADHYMPDKAGEHYVWVWPMTREAAVIETAEADRARSASALRELRDSIHALWAYLHEHYVEIDLDEAVRTSWKRWCDMKNEITQSMKR